MIIVRLAVTFDEIAKCLNIGPLDADSQEWLRQREIHTHAPMRRLADAWTNRPVGRHTLKEIAHQLTGYLQDEWDGFQAAGYGRGERVEFDVRAYEYRPVTLREELREL